MREPIISYGRRGRSCPEPSAAPLEVQDLRVRYPGAAQPAIDGVSVRVTAGMSVALLGPNGSGKSTLLKAVAGLLRPSGGRIRVFGQAPGAFRSQVAYLPQRGELDWRFPISVRRLVMTGRYVHLGWLRRPGRRDAAIVASALNRLGLAGLADRQIGRLSGGQQQRALLARALVQEAPLLLLDEPFNAVDLKTRSEFAGIITELRQRGTALVVATHEHDRLDVQFDDFLELGAPDSGFLVHGPPGAEECRSLSMRTPVQPGTRNREP
jgi:ABC-type Mn2+/Zn2+ transport system ATPase subunit